MIINYPVFITCQTLYKASLLSLYLILTTTLGGIISQWFSIWGDLPPGNICQGPETFLVLTVRGGAAGLVCVQGRGTGEQPAIHWAAPHDADYPAQNEGSAVADKSWHILSSSYS